MKLARILETYEDLVESRLEVKNSLLLDRLNILHESSCTGITSSLSGEALREYNAENIREVFTTNWRQCVIEASTDIKNVGDAYYIQLNRVDPITKLIAADRAGDFVERPFNKLVTTYADLFDANEVQWSMTPGMTTKEHVRLATNTFNGAYEIWHNFSLRGFAKSLHPTSANTIYATVSDVQAPEVSKLIARNKVVSVLSYKNDRAQLIRGSHAFIARLYPHAEQLAPAIQHSNIKRIEEIAFSLTRDGIPTAEAFRTAVALES